MPCTTIAAMTTHTDADSGQPGTGQADDGDSSRAQRRCPSSVNGVIRSSKRTRATATDTSGAAATMMLAVPAGTCSSLWLSSNWYAVMPKNPHAMIQPRSRVRGTRDRRAVRSATRAIAATVRRTNDSPITPEARVRQRGWREMRSPTVRRRRARR